MCPPPISLGGFGLFERMVLGGGRLLSPPLPTPLRGGGILPRGPQLKMDPQSDEGALNFLIGDLAYREYKSLGLDLCGWEFFFLFNLIAHLLTKYY